MNEVLKMWRVGTKNVLPVLVECPDGLWPNKDAGGVQIYENTHFERREDALEKWNRELLAGIEICGRDVRYYQGKLNEAFEKSGQAAREYVDFMDAERKHLINNRSEELE